MKKVKKKNNMGLVGFGRVQLKNSKTGEVEFETGFKKNNFTNTFRAAVLGAIVDTIMDSRIRSILLGSGNEPTVATAALPDGYTASTIAVTGTENASTQVRVTASWSSDQMVTTVANMGLLDAGTNSLLCGNTFSASFVKASNQDLNVTYDITWSSA